MLGHRTLNVEEYLTILKRRWWVIAIPAIILPILAVGATYLMTPEYVSSSVLLIDQQKVPSDFVKGVGTESLDVRLAYMDAKILSRTSMEPIVTRYNLYGDQHLSMDARIDLVRTKALKIAMESSEIGSSNPGFRITFTANDPQTARQVCSEITSIFTSENAKFNSDTADEATSFIQERLDAAKRTLDDQDKAVADFQVQHMGMLPGDQGDDVNIMGTLNSQLNATTQNIQTLEGQKSEIETLISEQAQFAPATIAATKSIPAEQTRLDALEAKQADMLLHYQADYPPVIKINQQVAALRAELAKAAAAPPTPAPSMPTPSRSDSLAMVRLRNKLTGIETQLADQHKQQDNLNNQIRGYEGKIQASPEIAAKYSELTRDSATDLALYNSLRSDMNRSQATTDLEQRGQGQTFEVLNEASLPIDPIFPKVSVFAIGGFAGGIALGLAIVAFLEYKDTALRTEREVWDFTHLPTLAVIAWSGEAADTGHAKRGHLKRLFSRKPSKDMLADAQG
jgi:polysaccharide chain length determinant protein (PEP-CTERM system associated)